MHTQKITVRKVSTDWKIMPSGLTWLLIGQPKTGKTTAASQWSEKGNEGVLLLDTDLGSDFVNGVNAVTISSLNPPFRPLLHEGKKVTKNGVVQNELVPPKERGFLARTGDDKGKPIDAFSLIEVYNWLATEWDKLPYDTVVIDTINQVNEWIETAVTEELGISAMGEGQWGADWGKARRKNIDIVKRFQRLIKMKSGNLVLVSHAKSTVVTDGKAQLGPELPRGLGYALAAKADVIGYITAQKDDATSYISFESYDERIVGSRLKPLNQKRLPFDYKTVCNEILNYKEEE